MANSNVPSDNVFKGFRQACREGRYWSVTTMPAPFQPWSPLAAHPEMETRRCHCSRSRIHRLRCGHLIAIKREAEQCAPNCVGMDMSKIIKGNVYIPEGGKERKPKKHPQEILDTNTKALQLYANAWLNPETAEGQQRAMKLWHVMTRVSFDAQKTHRPDLTKGDFNCKECGTEGGRPTAPAFPYPMAPLHLIIPVRNDEDAAVVKALEAGKVPFESKATQRNRKKGHGRRPKDKVQEGRITKKRVQEKQKVLSEIRNEDLMESVGSFNLLD